MSTEPNISNNPKPHTEALKCAWRRLEAAVVCAQTFVILPTRNDFTFILNKQLCTLFFKMYLEGTISVYNTKMG